LGEPEVLHNKNKDTNIYLVFGSRFLVFPMFEREIRCKSLLNASKLADYCINCYVGCGHGCKYCYADSITRRFSRHNERWGEFVDIKINAPEVLSEEILRKKRGSVFLSSLTDPYQPLEKKYQLTRKCLEILLKHQFPIIIQTKSSLVLRDLDLIKQFEDREVGFTITSLDEEVRKNFEPSSSSIQEKIDAIKILKENEIKVYVFFGPFLPYLSDRNLEEYFETMAKLKVDEVLVDKLNLKPGVWDNLSFTLEKNHPELVEKWREILFSKSNYWKELKKRITRICENKKLKYAFCY
jgi:DNA repair photolyase